MASCRYKLTNISILDIFQKFFSSKIFKKLSNSLLNLYAYKIKLSIINF